MRQAAIRPRQGSTIVGRDDLEDVRLVRVVRAERPLPFLAERSLQQAAEDRRLDLRPVEIRGRAHEQLHLVRLEMDARRPVEERAVRVRQALVDPVLRPRPLRRENLEEAAEVVGARP